MSLDQLETDTGGNCFSNHSFIPCCLIPLIEYERFSYMCPVKIVM